VEETPDRTTWRLDVPAFTTHPTHIQIDRRTYETTSPESL